MVTYLLNFQTDSEFVKVVTHLRVLIRKEFFSVRISALPRMTDLCVCVRFQIISSVCILSPDGGGEKRGLLQSRPNVRISQVGMTETMS